MNAAIALLTVIVLIGTFSKVQCQGTSVATADCSKGNEDACTSIEHAECAGDTPTCKCKQGYTHTPVPTACTAVFGSNCSGTVACPELDNSLCANDKCGCATGFAERNHLCVAVSSTVCSAGGKQCDAFSNAECDVSKTKCKCSDGFVENADTCDKIFGSHCSGTAACSGLDNSLCANDKCGCATGFAEKDSTCVSAVSSTTCSAEGKQCDAFSNAECDVSKTKCKCSDGFVENADTCDKKSGAVSVTSAAGLVFGSLIMLLVRVF